MTTATHRHSRRATRRVIHAWLGSSNRTNERGTIRYAASLRRTSSVGRPRGRYASRPRRITRMRDDGIHPLRLRHACRVPRRLTDARSMAGKRGPRRCLCPRLPAPSCCDRGPHTRSAQLAARCVATDSHSLSAAASQDRACSHLALTTAPLSTKALARHHVLVEESHASA
jgi:hypothetical protein